MIPKTEAQAETIVSDGRVDLQSAFRSTGKELGPSHALEASEKNVGRIRLMSAV